MHSRLRRLFRLLHELGVLSSSTPPFRLWHLVSGETTCFLRHLASTQLYPGSLVPSTSNFSMTNVSSIMPESFSFTRDRKSTRLNSSHQIISYAVFCLKKKNSST